MRPFPTHRTRSLDTQVRERLRVWPQCPPGRDQDAHAAHEVWLRGRPVLEHVCQPFLKLPGSDRLRTLPDGLWLNFGGTPEEAYVDIFGIMSQTPQRAISRGYAPFFNLRRRDRVPRSGGMS